MRKLTGAVAAAALAAVVPVAASAQTASGTVNASATVLAYLQVSNVSDLAFGSITPGDGATVAPGSAPGAGQSLGVLQIQHNSDLIVSAAVPAGLSLAGAPDLPVSFTCGYSATANGALIGAAAACGALPNRTGSGDGSTMTTYLQMGGAILGANTVGRVPGTYTGSVVFTITATY
jgi:hypothetical protein